MPIVLIYGLWNLTIVEVTGYVIYPGLDFASVGAWCEGLAVFPVGLLLWFLIYWATNYKINSFIRKHHDRSEFINDMDDSDNPIDKVAAGEEEAGLLMGNGYATNNYSTSDCS